MLRGKRYLTASEYKKAIIEFKVASQNMPKDAEPVYQLGMTYLRASAATPAEEAFMKAASLNPKHEGAQYQMALVKAGSDSTGLVQDARQVLTAFLAVHPGDADAMGALALADARLGNKPEALQLLEAVTQRDPANMRPAAKVIALYSARGEPDEAKAIAHDLSDRLPHSPDAATLRAQVSLGLEDTADADAQISRALALKRDFQPALQLRLRRELMNENRTGAEATTQELSKLPEKQTWGIYARLLFGEGKVDEGIAEFNNVLKEHGDDPELRDEYSGLLIGAKRNKEADALIAATLAKNPKDRIALLQRATTAIDEDNLNAAAEDIRTLQELKAFSPDLTYQESRFFGAHGEIVKQGDLLAEALRSNPRMLRARLDLSAVLANSGQGQRALEILDQTSATEKNSREYVYYRNMALMSTGNSDEARKSVDAALALSRSPGFLYQDAILRVRNHDLTGARKSLELAFRLAPADPNTLNLLGDVMKQQNESGKYIAMVRDAAANNPKSAFLQETLGKQLEILGDRNGARAAFEAMRSAGDGAKADQEIAYIDLRAGALDQARQRLLDLVKTHDSVEARFMLAEIETQKKSSADIVAAHYLKVLEMQPANVPAMNNLANLLASRQGKYDAALLWAQKALALAPGNPAVEDTVGWILYKQGKYDAALSYFEKSLQGSDQPYVRYHLAGALLAAGDPQRGREEYELALKLDPHSEYRAAVAPLFESTGRK